MHKFSFLFAALLSIFAGQAAAQNSVADYICGLYEKSMKTEILKLRQQGAPLYSTLNLFNNEKNPGLRDFLQQETREIFADPDKGRKYLESGQFRPACIKAYRGY